MAVAFLTIGVGITGLNASGYAVNILDIAPQYAGVIMGVTNVFGSAPGFISPQIVGILTPNKVNEFELVSSLFAIPQFSQLWLSWAGGFLNRTINFNSALQQRKSVHKLPSFLMTLYKGAKYLEAIHGPLRSRNMR